MSFIKQIDASKSAVIVVDKQNGYFDSAIVRKRHNNLPDDSAEILAKIDSFVVDVRNAGVEVIWTQMVENTEESPQPIVDVMRGDPYGATTITKIGEESFSFAGTTIPHRDEKVVVKYRYDAFAQTDLAEYLHSKGIATVIFVGGYATRCVLSSVVGANGHDFFCVVVKDLVVNPSSAKNEMETMFAMTNAIFGTTMVSDEVLSCWPTSAR